MIRWAEPNIREKDIYRAKKVLDSGWYSMGKEVVLLEEKMERIAKKLYAFAVNNGTSALTVSLRSLGIGKGDEVIVPALSYVATATAVSLVGAKPIFVDVDDSMTINIQKIDQKISKKTKAIIPVDFGGSPCCHSFFDLKRKEYGIKILVDGAQSIGATYNKKPCLSYGDISTTSFHIAKQISTVEGGMIFTNNEDIAKKVMTIRNQGEGKTKYVHEMLGGNYRMTDILASLAIGQVEEDRFKMSMEARKYKVSRYKELLKNVVDFLDVEGSGNFMFCIFSEKRDEIAKHLKENKVETRKYSKTIPQQPIYNIKESFPVAEWFVENMLSLPLHKNLSDDDIVFICNKIKEVVK